MAKTPSKQEVISQVLEAAERQIAGCHTATELQSAGKTGKTGLSKYEGVDEPYDMLDAMLHRRAEELNLCGPRAPFQIKFHHGEFLAPTPIIGTRLYVWFGSDKKTRWGDVTAIGEMGQVQVAMCYDSTEAQKPRYVGATHVTHPILESDRSLPRWDYMPGVVPEGIDFQLGLTKIANRERNALEFERLQREAEIQRARAAKAPKGEPVSV